MERKVVVADLEQDNKPLNKEEEKVSAESKTEEATPEESSEVVEEVVEEEATTEETPAEETEDVDASSEEEPEESASENDSEEEDADEEEVDALTYFKEIAEKAEKLVVQEDWSFVSNELANLALHIEDGPDSDEEEVKGFIESFNKLKEEFEAKKKAHYEELNKKKAENLEAKKELLKQFADIVNEEKWSHTKDVNQIRGKWENIKLLPHSEIDALNERFEELMVEFESHKVDRLVKKLQKEEENLTLKLVILEKMDKLNVKVTEAADFKELNDEFNDLLAQWRKVGRVPSEKNQATWDHFNSAQDKFNELRFKFDKEYRKTVEKALEKKQKLIKEAEALVDNQNIAQAARKVNKLHKVWKKTGNLPQKEENELWDKFKSATDAFNEKKSDNIDVLREQEQENLEKKYKLIEKAKEIQDTEDYDAGHQTMQNLMDQWKKIGPVPRKKSSKIWKQFKGAMDVFYDNRRDHFKDIRKDQKENMQRKNEILDKLKELGSHSDPAMAVEEAKKLQNEFKNVGHVPLKYKNKIWKQYREVCDVIYGNYRASGTDLGMERELASEGIEPEARKEIIKYQKKVGSLKKDISKLESEVIQFKEAKTYFKPTNKGNVLRDELQAKIDKAEKEIASKKDEISELRSNIRDLKASDESDEEE